MVKALKYVLLFILYYRYLSFRAQYQYSELLQLAFEACYAPRAFFYCFLELHLYRLLAKIAIKSESKVLIDRKCQDKTSLINVNSTNSDALLIRRIHVMITRNAVHRRTPDNGSSASPVQSDSRKGSGGSEACHHTYRSWHEWSGHPMKWCGAGRKRNKG